MQTRGREGFATERPRVRTNETIATVLASGLEGYLAAIHTGADPRTLVQEAGRTCPACGTGRCARTHAWRTRKRVTDLSTGEVFENLPILRVLFCDGSTSSLMPAELWRGRATVSSVLETTVHVLQDGVAAASDWVSFASRTGESLVSARTLRRWRDLVRTRLLGSAWSWLGPRLGLEASGQDAPAALLARLLERLEAGVLLAFRAGTGRAVIDTAAGSAARRARSPARRVAGRGAPAPPPDSSSKLRPRRAPWRHPRRGPPRRPKGDP